MERETLLHKIERYAEIIRSHRPHSDEDAKELDEYYKIGVTYSSNALEGNSLSLPETTALLESGVVAKGKSIRDYCEATGHARAYDFMMGIARRACLEITEDIIREMHRLFYEGIDLGVAGEYRTQQVYITGTNYLPPPPEDVSGCMKELVQELNAKRTLMCHPITLSAHAHRRLADIHPFVDGNGRIARLLMNLILVHWNYCPVSIPPIRRQEYISALQQANCGRDSSGAALVKLISECEIEAQKDYFRHFRLKIPQ